MCCERQPCLDVRVLKVWVSTESVSFYLQDFSYDDSKVEFNVDAPNGVVMEGYLFKRASNAFKTWNR